MAYEKQTWQTGDVITQEKLNHMEQGIEDGANGYECTETREQLFEETVTTVAQGNYNVSNVSNLEYSQQITAETLIVTFDGVEYNCPKQDVGGGYFVYGASTVSDFSQFPFSLGSSTSGNVIYTQTAGEHSIKAVSSMTTVTTTPCFEKAVNAAYDGLELFTIEQTGVDGNNNPTFNVSFEKCQQIASDFAQGKTLVRLIVREYGLETFLNVTAMRISTDSYVGTTCYILGNAIDDLNAGSSGLRVCFAKAEIRASGGTALTTRTKTIS